MRPSRHWSVRFKRDGLPWPARTKVGADICLTEYQRQIAGGFSAVPAPETRKQAEFEAASLIHRLIVRAALREIRHRGGVANFNVAAFARRVQRMPSMQRIYKIGRGKRLSEKTIWAILNGAGIIGKRGTVPKIH